MVYPDIISNISKYLDDKDRRQLMKCNKLLSSKIKFKGYMALKLEDLIFSKNDDLINQEDYHKIKKYSVLHFQDIDKRKELKHSLFVFLKFFIKNDKRIMKIIHPRIKLTKLNKNGYLKLKEDQLIHYSSSYINLYDKEKKNSIFRKIGKNYLYEINYIIIDGYIDKLNNLSYTNVKDLNILEQAFRSLVAEYQNNSFWNKMAEIMEEEDKKN